MNDQTKTAMQMAKEALEMQIHGAGNIIHSKMAWDALTKALEQPQGEWVDLTVDDIKLLVKEAAYGAAIMRDGSTSQRIARSAIAKFKEKNTPPVVPQGEPAAIPEWPEIETLADIDYAQCQKPESWDEGHFKAWQDLQVAQRNKIILHKYAKVLRELLQTTKPVVSQGEPVAWAYWPDCFDEKLDKGLLCNYEPTAYEKRRPLTYADTTPPSVEVAVDADSTNSCQKSNELVEPPKLHRAGSFGHD